MGGATDRGAVGAGTVDGLALYARDYAPLLPETGLPVICLHGLTRNSRDFAETAERLAGAWRTPLLWSMVLMMGMTGVNVYAIITWLPVM